MFAPPGIIVYNCATLLQLFCLLQISQHFFIYLFQINLHTSASQDKKGGLLMWNHKTNHNETKPKDFPKSLDLSCSGLEMKYSWYKREQLCHSHVGGRANLFVVFEISLF